MKGKLRKRVCRIEVEAQQHILEECSMELHQDGATHATKEDIFEEDVYHLKTVANKLQKTMDQLN